ncbi:hypothetical protein F5Y03DRAFT_397044 [Xylaria venustula]|nr:hypothetical protein F5Y03DRAFT_397044 [Xylaria venustula]
MKPDPVPRTYQVIPGALVNIVLKADQRTGRQVRGTVQDVLTRGDHHRGIKVRLSDGRIGRVQSMALAVEGESSTQSSSSSFPADAPNSSSLMNTSPENSGGSRGQGRRPRYRDARLEEPLDTALEQLDLGAYIVPSRRKGRGKSKTKVDEQVDETDNPNNGLDNNSTSYVADVSSAMATCPVCGTFEGDETAVAHHVAEHFGS